MNNSGQGPVDTLPDGVKGWCWGGFLLAPVWSVGNKTWIGLLSLVPYLGILMAIALGVKGRQWAWQNKRWDGVAHFNRVQRLWSLWGVAISLLIALAYGGLVYYATSGAGY